MLLHRRMFTLLLLAILLLHRRPVANGISAAAAGRDR